MFEWLFKKPGPKEEWRLCKTLVQGTTLTETNSRTGEKSEKEGKTFYHLLESNLGNRKCDVQGIGKDDSGLASDKWKSYVYSTDIYQLTIYPWLQGRMNPEIPTYQDVPTQEMKDYLSKQ